MATLRQKRPRKAVAGALALAQQIANFPAKELWLNHDAEADVLFISLKHPQKATDTVELEDGGMLLRYRGKELVGITVLDASKR
jgi:uncharacterized protein YuzE